MSDLTWWIIFGLGPVVILLFILAWIYDDKGREQVKEDAKNWRIWRLFRSGKAD